MTKARWKTRIKKACKEAGTYQPFFDSVINQLAELMEIRDRAQEQFVAGGCMATIRRNESLVKNPELVILLDCNAQALSYWRDLGLTPKGFKALSGEAPKPAATGLETLISELEKK